MENIKLIFIFLVILITGCATTSQARASNHESRKNYVESHLELSLGIKQAILQGKVIEGMTKQDVFATWGEPNNTSKYEEPDEQHAEDWYYYCFFCFPAHKYVRFGMNGLVNYVSVDYK